MQQLMLVTPFLGVHAVCACASSFGGPVVGEVGGETMHYDGTETLPDGPADDEKSDLGSDLLLEMTEAALSWASPDAPTAAPAAAAAPTPTPTPSPAPAVEPVPVAGATEHWHSSALREPRIATRRVGLVEELVSIQRHLELLLRATRSRIDEASRAMGAKDAEELDALMHNPGEACLGRACGVGCAVSARSASTCAAASLTGAT